MIPVRVPADLTVHTVGGVRTLTEKHALYETPCPVCGYLLEGYPITLVAVGIPHDERKPAGWTTGGAVAVHAECAGIDHPDNPSAVKGEAP